ncbi:MAG TPA: YqhA family protein [Streptosporangiaceae bacterium]
MTGEPESTDARAPIGTDGDGLPGPQRAFERALALSRLLVLIPVVFLVLDAAASFVYGADILIRTLTEVVSVPAHVGARLGRFLIVMDTFLVGVTLMILAFGFYELFVITREQESHKYWLPGWLQMHDIEDLKARVVSMLILVAAITFVDRLVESKNKQEILFLGVGISIIIVALTAFLWIGRTKPPGRRPQAVPATAGGPAGDPRDLTVPRRSEAEAGAPATRPRRDRVTAVLGGTWRTGRWPAAAEMSVRAIGGRARLDLREAELPDREIRISAVAGLGTVSIIVPPEMQVAESGVSVLGIRSIRGGAATSHEASSRGGAPAGAPVLVLADTCVLGLVKVRRMAR